MSTMSRVTIQEKCELPSRGKFPGIPPEITLRAMSLLDEKQRLASTGISGIVDLVGNCIVKPEGLDPYQMPMFDIDWAMLKLRIVSHGPLYKANVVCPKCGHTMDKTINLDDIPMIPVEEDFVSEFEIGPLPISGDTLKVRLLTYKDLMDMQSESQRILSKFPEYKGDPLDVLDYIYKIVEVNGEKKPPTFMKPYVESMSAADSIYFDQAYSDKISTYGPDTQLTFQCDKCNETFIRSMPMNAEFFRPRYNATKR